MRIFKMQYIKNGTDGVMLVEAKDRWDAIKSFLKRVGKRQVSDLDYFHVEEVTVRVKTCFECTAYVDIDGEQPRSGLFLVVEGPGAFFYCQNSAILNAQMRLWR